MGVFSKFKDMMGFEEYEEDDIEVEEEEDYKGSSGSYYDRKPVEPKAQTTSPRYDSNVVPMQNRTVKAITSAFKLVVIEPKGFEECPKLVDSLKGRRPIIINLEKLETEVARKIFDFMSGATYALNGNVQKVANNIFIFAPENVDISSSQEERTSFDFSSEEKSPWR